MKLTLAIPAHNDLTGLCQLLARTASLGIAEHVVVVDDGSDTPIDKDTLLAACRGRPEQLTLLRNDTARGPGVARNHALEHVPTPHMLFMDADDLPTRELVHLLQDLDGKVFDFCLFQHHDTRQEREHSWGQMPHEQTLWQAAGVDLGALNPVPPDAAVLLSRTANYPWNKIYRTGFLRENGIGCSEIMVHEDVELHWRSFLNARHILASDRVAAIHFVTEGGARLTNRTGPERLDVFVPLERIAAEITTRTKAGETVVYALPFFRFVIGLLDWISGNLRPEFQTRFETLARGFLRDHVPANVRAGIALGDPTLRGRHL